MEGKNKESRGRTHNEGREAARDEEREEQKTNIERKETYNNAEI